MRFAGANQPARRSFEIATVEVGNHRIEVIARDPVQTPFCALLEFSRADQVPEMDLLVVAPLSGHSPILLRDLVIGLIPHFRVFVTDWINARYIPVEHGAFSLERNVACVLEFANALRSRPMILGLCQGGIPALAATALLSANHPTSAPSGLILMAAPIDPIAAPSRVSRLLRSRSLTWMQQNLIGTVPDAYPGHGRQVYPAQIQLAALLAYLARHVAQGSEMWRKLMWDDGLDPSRFPFFDLYSSIIDLDAACFLENIRFAYHEGSVAHGHLRCRGEPVDLRAITRTVLLTIEGEWDDVAAPGQTSAAHDLCRSLPAAARGRIVVPCSGHFSLFHGETWRRVVLPELLAFSQAARSGYRH